MKRAEQAKARALIFLPFLSGLPLGRFLPEEGEPRLCFALLLAAAGLLAYAAYGSALMPLLSVAAGAAVERRAGEWMNTGALPGREGLLLAAFVLPYFFLAVQGMEVSRALRLRRSLPPRVWLWALACSLAAALPELWPLS